MILGLLLALPAAFDGASWQDAAPCDDLADTTFSVCARVQNTTGASSISRVAVSAAYSVTSDQYVYLGINNSLYPECTYRSGTQFTAKGKNPLPPGEHDIFCVSDGATLSVLLDGAVVGSVAYTSATIPGPRDRCTYGALRRSSGTSNYWIGYIAAAKTWDRALFPAEVAAGCGTPQQPAEQENCHGSTALIWDPYPDPTITHFEVERTVSGVDAWSVVGSTKEKNRPAFEERPAYRAETWDLLRAWSLPVEGVTYAYRVTAVREGTSTVKSGPSNVFICGPQDPTTCYPLPCPGAVATKARDKKTAGVLLAFLAVVLFVIVWRFLHQAEGRDP